MNDGPGIRTVIFLKGCPLRCAWCHNPEGIAFEPQYMEKKTGRTLCGYAVDATALAEKMRQHRDVFEMSGGGVTLSGGEPLAQPLFVAEFLQQAAPVHRVIETSGYAPAAVFRETVALTDLVLFDLKLMDDEKHRQYTGVSNRQILENLDYLCVSGKSFIIRIPLIPEVNDNEANMLAALEAIRGAASLLRVELMPYNKFAGAKYSMLGQTFAPPFDASKAPDVINIFEKHNIKTVVL